MNTLIRSTRTAFTILLVAAALASGYATWHAIDDAITVLVARVIYTLR